MLLVVLAAFQGSCLCGVYLIGSFIQSKAISKFGDCRCGRYMFGDVVAGKDGDHGALDDCCLLV